MLSYAIILALRTAYAGNKDFDYYLKQITQYQQEIKVNGESAKAKNLEEEILLNFADAQKSTTEQVVELKANTQYYQQKLNETQAYLEKYQKVQAALNDAANELSK